MRGGGTVQRELFDIDTISVAKSLLGMYLVHETEEQTLIGKIVETEAYLQDDPAAHAYGGETPRNKAMFGPPGRAYIYLIYGIYYCMNCTTRESGIGEAVLIRAVEPVAGIDQMRELREKEKLTELTSGPGKLTQAMAITMEQYGLDLLDPDSPLRIEQGSVDTDLPIKTTTRVGISQAKDRLLRFFLEGSPYVSQ